MLGKRQFPVRCSSYKFGVSSRFVTKLKSEGAALLEEAEKNGHCPFVEANTRRLKKRSTDSSNLRDLARFPVTQSTIKERSLLIRDEILRRNDLTSAQRAQLEKLYGIYGDGV